LVEKRRLSLWQNGSGETKTAIRVEIGLLAFLLLLLSFWVFTLGTIFTESGISNELNKRHVKRIAERSNYLFSKLLLKPRQCKIPIMSMHQLRLPKRFVNLNGERVS